MLSQTLAIETMGLSKHFGQHRAVDTLDLAIHHGAPMVPLDVVGNRDGIPTGATG